jgi:glycosyltransferase involved in cell wall biosynthesis
MRPPFADYYEALQALVKRLNLQDRVTFYGHVADPVHWYRRIDVFVSNSYSEGLQVSPMEAIASGCYCLSHWWDGADELLPQDNLFYTDPELIRKLVEYCDAPEHERQARCARLQAMVRNKFDVDQTKVRIRQLVEEVAASRLQTLEGAPKPR